MGSEAYFSLEAERCGMADLSIGKGDTLAGGSFSGLIPFLLHTRSWELEKEVRSAES